MFLLLISGSCGVRLDRKMATSGSLRSIAALSPQVSQVGNAALTEREAGASPLDHAIGFELANVSPGAIQMQTQSSRADVGSHRPNSFFVNPCD